MKISVVIPAYNAAGCIKDAIDSCIAQTHTPHEIIVIDDASNDDTVSIVEQYHNVILLRQMENKGPSAARNLGWNAASGDVIAFLDSDDTWHPKKLEVINDILSANESILYLGHNYTVGKRAELSSVDTPKQVSYTSILIKNPYQPSCLVVRKSLDLRFNESYRYCEDHELSVRVAYRHHCHWLDMPLTILGRPQLSTGGASGNKWKMRKGELRLYTSVWMQNPLFIIFVPILLIFSLLKMSYRLTK
ncbi:MAG: glycosyltransferase family 2 protein [Chitinophagales bacterium]|nr:glycosyltransferase family 2 protein [Chitinophagales bacterium]